MRTLLLGILAAFILHVHSLETTTEAEITACNDNQCNSACIAVHWNGGYCKNGDCWCWKRGTSERRVEKLITEIQSSTKGVSVCHATLCDHHCRDIHWDGGYCRNGECWCWRRTEFGREEKQKSELQSTAPSCNTSRCSENCTAIKWNGGYCQRGSGECWCWKTEENFKQVERPLSSLTTTAPVSENLTCTTAQCEKECGGHCKGGKCWCHTPNPTIVDNSPWTLFHDLPPNFRDIKGRDVTFCTPNDCLLACSKEDAFSGFCLKNLCWCTLTNEEVIGKRNVRPVIELQAHDTVELTDDDRCHPSDCRRQCRNDNKTGGAACFYGYCWCDNEPQKINDKQVRKQMFMHNQR